MQSTISFQLQNELMRVLEPPQLFGQRQPGETPSLGT